MTTELAETQKTQLAYIDNEQVAQIAQIVQKVAPWANGMSNADIGLAVRRAMAMGVDPLNPHEVQIWKDNRGTINTQIAYTLMGEWVKRFHGEHTNPIYTRLTGEQLEEEGLSPDDVAYYCRFVMIKDLPKITQFVDVFGADVAREMFTVVGLGVAQAQEYSSKYFAPSARSKSWKVKKRALTDAYRRKFGTPTRAEVVELRREMGFDKIQPDDWAQTEGLDNGDAVALARATASRREPVLTEGQAADAADALFSAPDPDVIDAEFTESEPESPPKPNFWEDPPGAAPPEPPQATPDDGGPEPPFIEVQFVGRHDTKRGKPRVGFWGVDEEWPKVHVWSRDDALEVCPAIGLFYTKEELGGAEKLPFCCKLYHDGAKFPSPTRAEFGYEHRRQMATVLTQKAIQLGVRDELGTYEGNAPDDEWLSAAADIIRNA